MTAAGDVLPPFFEAGAFVAIGSSRGSSLRDDYGRFTHEPGCELAVRDTDGRPS